MGIMTQSKSTAKRKSGNFSVNAAALQPKFSWNGTIMKEPSCILRKPVLRRAAAKSGKFMFAWVIIKKRQSISIKAFIHLNAPRLTPHWPPGTWYMEQGEKENAKEYYHRALAEYEFLIKENEYIWNKKDNDDRLLCLKALASFEKTPEETGRARKLGLVLEKTAAYCKRLDSEMIHFFCHEAIHETFESDEGAFENSLVYEYQLIKEKTGITERRILLDRNGEKFHREDVPLDTLKYKYEFLIYGPIAFFKKSFQDRFEYKLVGEETRRRQKVVVVEVLPLKMGDWKPLCGKVWLDSDDYSILKIKWHPKFLIENFHESLDSARRLNSDLVVDYFSEFDIEKDGIRYPSRYWVKEYRVAWNGKKKSSASLDAAFRKYSFFSVGTEVTYDE
jgi:hypothetical protein